MGEELRSRTIGCETCIVTVEQNGTISHEDRCTIQMYREQIADLRATLEEAHVERDVCADAFNSAIRELSEAQTETRKLAEVHMHCDGLIGQAEARAREYKEMLTRAMCAEDPDEWIHDADQLLNPPSVGEKTRWVMRAKPFKDS